MTDQPSLAAQGIAAYQRGENQKAYELLQRATQIEPHNAEAWYCLSKLETDPVKRKKMLQQVLKINSKHRSAQYDLAVITSELRMAPPQIKPAEEADTLHSPQKDSRTFTLTPQVNMAHKIETTATVSADGHVYMKLKVNLPPGTYKAVIVLEEK